jgi:hypothetical protein
MVNPRVPSGILGPCAACRGLAARLSKCSGAPAACAEECGVCGGLPRPLPHGFLAPTCWSWSSSCCQDERANRAHQFIGRHGQSSEDIACARAWRLISAYAVVREVRRRRGVGGDLRLRRALLVGGGAGEVIQARPLQPCYRLGLW